MFSKLIEFVVKNWISILVLSIICPLIVLLIKKIFSKDSHKKIEKFEQKKNKDRFYNIGKSIIISLNEQNFQKLYEIVKNTTFFRNLTWSYSYHDENIFINNNEIRFGFFVIQAFNDAIPSYQIEILDGKNNSRMGVDDLINYLINYFEKIDLFTKNQLKELKKIGLK